jgi:homoserine O-acetyltransferase
VTKPIDHATSLYETGLEEKHDLLVERRPFELGRFTTGQGAAVADARFGWERYGTLNSAGSNAILVNHFFLGFGHAAGRYSAEDRYSGFWNDMIGPGKALDTRKFCVIATDCLCNVYAHHPHVVTTGPASIDPRTGEPYGMSFPLITVRDIVAAQKALLDDLGITRLQAIVGAGFGGAQAYAFAAAYPDAVARIIPICATAETDGWQIAWMSAWTTPIRLDPHWNNGDYYRGTPPTAGLIEAMKMIYLNSRHWTLLQQSFGRHWADPEKDPTDSLVDDFAVERALNEAAARRAHHADGNHVLYLTKANQTFQLGDGVPLRDGLAQIRAAVLTVHTPNDQLYAGPSARAHLAIMMRNGTRLRAIERSDVYSHVEAISDISPIASAIRRFLH